MAHNRSETLKSMSPNLVADVELYRTEDGGRKAAVLPGWGCPCMASQEQPLVGYDGWMLLGESSFAPGERRRVGFVFPFATDEACRVLGEAGTFYLWEGRFVGKAVIAA